MAAQLKDGGRYPANQRLPQAEFIRLAESCQNPKPASKRFKDLMANAGKKKS
jgi:hypothetical protein